MKELIEALGNNIKTVCYDTKKKLWTITYKTDLKPDTMDTATFLDFIEYGG